ncbi:uncharacterized protein LOC127252856 [Andrographis paniculata]|uniref:uncharacterized protein LOC127252856 n=1 Tax=Andrographis paniculata TaxID=175694 RepID=UPI0021E93D80|nr:uncharacterized protein LOC127252856 [Andrographis paniculata]
MASHYMPTLFFSFTTMVLLVHGYGHTNACRSFCGNLTIDYPFALKPGCGHQGFRELLFCINDVLMLHITSGSYRVLDIDYAYGSLVLHDPHMSTCDTITLGNRGNGFVVEPWRSPYMKPTPETVFMLLACSSRSPLFQGLPGKHTPCRNVSGLGCEDYYGCPAWDVIPPRQDSPVYETGPPDCCAMPYESIKSVNLTSLDCQGYSSAYSAAPLRVKGADEWDYGIQVKYSAQGGEMFCRACEATGGSCGYDLDKMSDLCMCGRWNSTSNCDSVSSDASSSSQTRNEAASLTGGVMIIGILWRYINMAIGME